LLVVNITAWLGGVLAFSLMTGALFMHATKLGISVQGDGGYLFSLALIVALCSLYVVMRNKEQIFRIVKWGRSLAWRK
jgi:putative oxidoreductase